MLYLGWCVNVSSLGVKRFEITHNFLVTIARHLVTNVCVGYVFSIAGIVRLG